VQRDIKKGVGHKESRGRGRGSEARVREVRFEEVRGRKVRCGELRDCTRKRRS
jgi:hypothetical protein